MPPHLSNGNRKGVAIMFVVILVIVAFLGVCAVLARRIGGDSSEGGDD